MEKLSVVMPVFNERSTIGEIVRRVLAVDLPLELVVVDDGSTDGTQEELERLAVEHRAVRLFRHPGNRGKSAAIRTALQQIQGDVVVIQDADLEYDPGDYLKLLSPIVQGQADVVYGSRFMGDKLRVFNFWNALANRVLTGFSNLMTGLSLSDMETCYKMFKAELVRDLDLASERFGIEPELTAAFARMDVRIYEVPISYAGRSHVAGKKIGVRDGFEALFCIAKFNLAPWRPKRRSPRPGAGESGRSQP